MIPSTVFTLLSVVSALSVPGIKLEGVECYKKGCARDEYIGTWKVVSPNIDSSCQGLTYKVEALNERPNAPRNVNPELFQLLQFTEYCSRNSQPLKGTPVLNGNSLSYNIGNSLQVGIQKLWIKDKAVVAATVTRHLKLGKAGVKSQKTLWLKGNFQPTEIELGYMKMFS